MNDNIETQAAQLFRRAARYIRTYGWREKGMSVYGRPRCSMGALASVWPEEADGELADLMYRVLYDELAGLSLTEFNHKYQNGEKVAQLYERTADKLTALQTPALNL